MRDWRSKSMTTEDWKQPRRINKGFWYRIGNVDTANPVGRSNCNPSYSLSSSTEVCHLVVTITQYSRKTVCYNWYLSESNWIWHSVTFLFYMLSHYHRTLRLCCISLLVVKGIIDSETERLLLTTEGAKKWDEEATAFVTLTIFFNVLVTCNFTL